MKCPDAEKWDVLAMEALEAEEAEPMSAHARTCAACRARYGEARRAHIDRVRMYEAFDRDHDELREQLMAALPDGLPRRSRTDGVIRVWHRLGGYAMSLNTTTGRRTAALLAPAACILIIVTLFVSSGQKSAFATAIEQLRLAKTIACHVTTTTRVEMKFDPQRDLSQIDPEKLKQVDEFTEESIIKTERLYMSADHGVRRDEYDDGVLAETTYVMEGGPTLILHRANRTYEEYEGDEVDRLPEEVKEVVEKQPMPDVHFRFMHAPDDPDHLIRGLRNLTADADRELGRDIIDGSEVIGYEIAGEKVGFGPPWTDHAEENHAELWVDAETGTAVRLVFRLAVRVRSMKDMPLESTLDLTTVYDDFELDPPLPHDWFEPIIPEDYSRDQEDQPEQMELPDEAALLEALKVFGELAGRYPASLRALSLGPELSALAGSIRAQQLVAEQTGREPPDLPDMKSLHEKFGGFILGAFLEMSDRGFEYFGESITPGDAETVLMRWHLEDGQIRIVYGDLRTETLPESD